MHLGVQGHFYKRPRALAGRQVKLDEEQTGSLTTTAARCYATYWGALTAPITAFDVFAYVNGVAAANSGYAELGVATSTASDLFANSVTLTIGATSASIDTEVKAASTVMVRKSLTGLSIPAFADIWILCVASYDVTQASFRMPGNGSGDTRGYTRIAASTRISTNLGAAVAFTCTVGTTQANPYVSGEPR